MSRIVWGDPDKRLYETGVDRGVFYPQGGAGVPWNGLLAVSEAPSGSDIRKSYYDGELFRQQRASESFAARISAITYPREFEEYDGVAPAGHTAQARKTFGFSYRTSMFDDLGNTYYLIHLVYNALVSPSKKSFVSIGGAINPNAFEWDISTIPEFLPNGEASAHVIIDTRIAYPWALNTLENILYGIENFEPRLPSILEVVQIFEDASLLRITDNLDGTWTADGPEDAIEVTTSGWNQKRINLFNDPLAKTILSSSWSSTSGMRENVTDPDGTSWVRFARGATGNVRLADLKVGSDMMRNTAYRFTFKMRSPTAKSVAIYVRTAVDVSGSNSVFVDTIDLEPNIPRVVDFVKTTPNSYESTLAGVAITHSIPNGIGDTLDITEVNVELPSTANRNLVHGDAGVRDYSRYRWLATPNQSSSVYEERDETFEITWPSAVYIDADRYRISSL